LTTATAASGTLARAKRLHAETTVVDLVSPLFFQAFTRAVDEYPAGGVAIIGASVDLGADEQGGAAEAFRYIALNHEYISRAGDKAMLVESVADMRRAKERGRLGVLLHFQNSTPFERSLGYVELFHRLGIRVAGLTYNIRNAVGDGCIEPADGGLSRFGRRLVKEMGRVGIQVDGSHTRIRTTLQAMEVCEGPFIFSHNGCKAVYDHPRNITDEQIKACAASGGVMGILVLPYFLSASREPKLEDVVRHILHALELVGPDHVALGMDYFTGMLPYITAEQQAAQRWETSSADLLWERAHRPDGPWAIAPEIQTPAGLHSLTAALLDRGVAEADLRKFLGGNWIRVLGTTWRS
jgi:membrane dipeptidase